MMNSGIELVYVDDVVPNCLRFLFSRLFCYAVWE